MATSRSGTARHKNLRAQAIHDARQAGQTACPICRHQLDWDGPRGPRSPEMDHITSVEHGGRDVSTNVRIICGDCNRKRRGRERLARVAAVRDPIVTSQAW